MNKQDCLLQLGEAAREINGYRNAAHLMELQVKGYCNRIKEFKARDAQLVIVLGKLFEMDIWDLKLDVDFQKWFLKTKWDYVDKDFEEMCEGELNETATEQYHHFEDELLRSEYLLSRLKALLLVEEEAKTK